MAYTEAGKFNTRIAFKHDTEANWVKAKNFIPLEGEIIIYDADENYSYQRIKIGDGTTKVKDLPFDNIQGDWNQNDETAPDYVKNRTHYVENSREEIEIHLGTKECSGFTIDTSMPVIAGKTAYQSTLPQGEEDPYFNYGDYPIGSKFRLEIKQSNDCIFSQILTWHEEGAGNTNPDTGGWLDESAIGNADLTNPWDYSFGTLNTGELASIYTNDTDQYVSFYLDDTIQLSPDSVITISLYYLDSIEKVVQLDEKFIPNTIARTNGVVRSAGYDSQGNHIADTYAKKSEITDLFTPIDIMAELGAKDVSWNWYDDNWPKTDEDIVNMLTTVTANNQWPDDLFIKLFSLFETYPGILPAFGFFPKASRHGCKYKLTCSTERVEIDSYQETGSTIHPDFNFTYFINLSKDNYLELRFNYNSPDETAIDWDSINLDNLYLTFDLIPKGGNITTEQVAALAQEQIITPALTEEVY